MRLILVTQGTLGDHLPMVGLGCALQQRGYTVLLACNPAVHALAERAGLAVVPFGDALGPQQAVGRPIGWDHWLRNPDQVVWDHRDQTRVTGQVQQLLGILEPGDVLIGTRNLSLLSLIARVRGCRWVEVGVNSGSMIDYDRLAESRPEPHPWSVGLERLETALRDQLLGTAEKRDDPPPMLRLHAVPEAFVPHDYPQLPCERTGFWRFDDPLWQAWSPHPALEARLGGGPAPLVLAFSSQPLVDPLTLLRKHLQVAELLGRPLLLVKGWAFTSLDPESDLLRHPALVALDPLPFRWLFNRAQTAFIHGGMGTLAAALDGGCRLVIEPFGNDQFLNARLATAAGLAWAVHPHRFDPEQVAALLAKAGQAAASPPESPDPAGAPEASGGTEGLERAADLLAAAC